MADLFRIDISVEVQDKTNPGLDQANRKITGFEKSLQRTREQIERMNQIRFQLLGVGLPSAQRGLDNIWRSLFSITSRTWHISMSVLGTPLRVLNSIKNTLFKIPTLIAGMTTGMAAKQVFLDPLKMANDFQNAQMAFGTMLGGDEKGNAFLKSLDDFAERTPFSAAGLRSLAQRMLEFKFQSKDVIPYLTAIGDWAGLMGKGEEGIDRVTLALGLMKEKGRVQGDEMQQLTKAGINAYDYLSQAMGKSTAELMKMQEKGLIPADKAIDAIIQGLTRDFGGGMKRQESTTRELWNRIKKTFDSKIVKMWGLGLDQGINPVLKDTVDGIDANKSSIDQWSQAVQNAGDRELPSSLRLLSSCRTGGSNLSHPREPELLQAAWHPAQRPGFGKTTEGRSDSRTAKSGQTGCW
jgi:tape measure domain-containing protein